MKRLLFLGTGLVATLLLVFIACSKEPGLEPAKPDTPSPYTAESTERDGGPAVGYPCISPCKGTFVYEHQSVGSGSEYRLRVQIYKRHPSESSWTLVQNVDCTTNQTINFEVDHEKLYRVKVGYQNILCGNHPNWQLRGRVKLYQGLTLMSFYDFQNGEGFWDLDTQNNPVFMTCPNCPLS